MIAALLLFGGLAAGGFGLLASRRAVDVPPQQPPPQEQPPAQQPPVQQQPPPQQPPKQPPKGREAPALELGGKDKDKGLGELGEAGLVGALGAGLGFLASVGANDTKEAKAAAPAIGAGVALAAYLANVGGVAAASGLSATLGAFAVIALPILEVTYAIVVIVDQVLRFAKSQQWREMAMQVRKLREAGQFREALELFVRVAPNIEPIARIWPQPNDDWYNAADQFGRPYPGFPGPPAPATAADVKRWPSLVPSTIQLRTPDGGVVEKSPAALLDAAYSDVEAIRDALLAAGTPGVDVNGKTVTTGPRDIRKTAPQYAEALALADGWARKLAAAGPWLSEWRFVTVDLTDPKTGAVQKDLGGNPLKTEVLQPATTPSDALVRDIRTAVEKARDEAARAAWQRDESTRQQAALARARADDAQPVTSSGKVIRPTSRTQLSVPVGVTVPPVPLAPPAYAVQLAVAQGRDTTAQQRTGAVDREESGPDGARTGRTRPTNNSGSGGRNA